MRLILRELSLQVMNMINRIYVSMIDVNLNDQLYFVVVINRRLQKFVTVGDSLYCHFDVRSQGPH